MERLPNISIGYLVRNEETSENRTMRNKIYCQVRNHFLILIMKECIFIIEKSILDKVNSSESETSIKITFVVSLALQKCGTFGDWKFMQTIKFRQFFTKLLTLVSTDLLPSPGIFQLT